MYRVFWSLYSFRFHEDCPNILYLTFADDCIFGKAKKNPAEEIKYILDHYYKVLLIIINQLHYSTGIEKVSKQILRTPNQSMEQLAHI